MSRSLLVSFCLPVGRFQWQVVRSICAAMIFALCLAAAGPRLSSLCAQEPSMIKIGIIGLDTSHAPEFAKLFNAESAEGEMKHQQVTHAFPGGSHDIESSHSRVPGYTKKLQEMGIEIVDSVDALVSKVDAVMLLSLDGRKHLEQVRPIMEAKKPVYIDKPLAGSLAQAIAIRKLGEKTSTRWFTSSSLRFSSEIIRYREDESKSKSVRGAISWGPCSLEATHPDLYWYGVHGVETLYTAMGKGCDTVTRVSSQGTDIAVGKWSDGRIGEFRGIRDGASGYGLVVFGDKAIEVGGKYDGYGPLANRIAMFFRGTYAGVDVNESIEMFTFMEAADESKRNGGAPVSLQSVYNKALEEANRLVP